MSYEMFESDDTKLASFQNDSFVDNSMNKDLMPKIRFTTDASEAGEASKANRGNPFNLPDSVFYVEPKESGDTNVKEMKSTDISGFQNDSFNIKVDNIEQNTSTDTADGDYYGSSSSALEIKIENATKDLTYAQLQLENAIESGTGVMTAMGLVDNAQKLVDTYVEQHSKAVMAEALQAETGDIKLGSVSHAKWELEEAYKSGNSTWIHNAEKNLAHEMAKEKSKELS